MVSSTQTYGQITKERVLKSLSDPRWDFRTIEGIAKETQLSSEEVTMAVESLLEEGKARESAVPDRLGRALYTLKTKPVSARESLAEVRSFF